MIRDPSDGTVKEKSAPPVATSHNTGERLPNSDAADGGADTGLPTISKEKAEEFARLEKSREWLKAYSLKSGFSPSTQ